MRKTASLIAILIALSSAAHASPRTTSRSQAAPSRAKARLGAPAQKPTTPRANRPYRFVEARTCGAISGPSRTNDYRCVEQADNFLAGETVHLWAKFEAVSAKYQYLVKTFRDGKLIKQSKSNWHPKSPSPVSSYLVAKEVNTMPGAYRSDFYVDVGSGFERVGSREYGVSVLSPVEGGVRHQCHWPAEDDVWAFCEHAKTGRRSSRGVALANDAKALDINLRAYSDVGKAVYPVAPGKIVKYGDQHLPGKDRFAGVLVEHQTADGQKWWSGYLHMRRESVRVQVGQEVDVDEPLGTIGRSGTSNSHLHIVMYKGENKLGALKSFEVDFRARTGAEMRRLARQRLRDDDQG